MKDWIVKYWLSAVFGVITGALGWAVKRMRKRQLKQEAEQAAIKEGMLALLHSEIYRTHKECEQKGYADIQDRENLETIYNSYHTLGGNGTGTDLYNITRKLPTEPPQKATA